VTTATPTIELATAADLAAIHTLRLAQGWSATDEVMRAVSQWERGRLFVIRESALAGGGKTFHGVAPDATPAAADDSAAEDATHAQDAPVVTVGAIAAGPVGMIGSVIVRDDYQRRGLGRYIMGYALDWLRAMGARAVYLDATPAGRPLYTSLGFESMGARSWYTLTPLAAIDHGALAHYADGLRATSVDTNDARAVADTLNRLAALDLAAFGGDRIGLVAALVQRPGHQLYVVNDATGAPAGYLVAYPSGERYQGMRVGPWVATSQATAAALLLAALQSADEWLPRSETSTPPNPDEAEPKQQRAARYTGPQMVLSLPGTNPQALELLRGIGCELVLDDLMMRLDLSNEGTNGVGAQMQATVDMTKAESSSQTLARLDADSAQVYAWMASMVF